MILIDFADRPTIWAKFIKFCTTIFLIPAIFNPETGKYKFQLCSCKLFLHILIWQISPILLTAYVDGQLHFIGIIEIYTGPSKVTLSLMLSAASSGMALFTKVLSLICVPFTLAFIVSKVEVRQRDLFPVRAVWLMGREYPWGKPSVGAARRFSIVSGPQAKQNG